MDRAEVTGMIDQAIQETEALERLVPEENIGAHAVIRSIREQLKAAADMTEPDGN